ncbi:MAG TPA: alpha-L-arabinofuranosidase C-terminal domain-containing protein, partial [Verrucomicrobiae bacterium]|nr:alpha-L-arabinofuranosidase C-terminal domain-containing protein [Verrucomicrobiae bacterium]
MKIPVLTVVGCMLARLVLAQATITVDVNRTGHPIPRTLWGIFFEDINLSADGGIYPELVRNRSFEDSDRPAYWKLSNAAGSQSAMDLDESRPLNPFNRHSLRVNANGTFTLENDGYWGMNILQGAGYTFRVATRAADGFTGPLEVRIVGSTGRVLARGEISGLSARWKYHTLDLTATGSDPQAKLQISGNGSGTVFLDMVSLMPQQTWKNHGLRTDLCESLDALHPSFMRFPGGNWIEGDDLAHMYHWKSTIGPVDSRTPLWNTWGYNTTQGLGFEEYLQLCEDLGAEPVFAINCGMSLRDSVPLGQMGQWIQDALDAIEYANGPTNSVWGSLRAQAGHPAPFHLKYMEIGNENGGRDYWQRWALLANAIRRKYPDMQLIMTTSLSGYPYPPDPKPDIVDEHYYESPESFMRRADQYDTYSRKGPKIFVGEYAVTQGAGQGNLRAAIGEAALMTGIERNSDVVLMASYAPLFVNVHHRAWNPDLISFDGSRWFGSPSYYVQQMFSDNRGDVTLPITVVSGKVPKPPPSGGIGVGTWNTEAEFKDIKVTAPGGTVLFTSDFDHGVTNGWKFLGNGDWNMQDGALRQTVARDNSRALAGDRSWTDYTLELKARKLGGSEGFLVLFHVKNDQQRSWWNVGGWGDTQDAVEMDETMDAKPSHIETGRWYDLKVQVRGDRIRCWLDGRLVHDLTQPGRITHPLYASATRDDKNGDVILKVVNAAGVPVRTTIDLPGATSLTGSGEAMVLTASSPWEENSLEDPTNVSPRTEAVSY